MPTTETPPIQVPAMRAETKGVENVRLATR
jgi:hypothetical protein